MRQGVMGMRWILILTLLFALAQGELVDPDAILNGTELIQKYGCTAEEHNVRTEDGYELSVFRAFKKEKKQSSYFPLIMQHGLTGSADNYLCNGNRSSPYYFAELGYDVWLPNSRGTRYSSRHKTLNPDQSQFWNFTFEESGVYDLPAVIEHILKTTQSSKVLLIGHTEGSAQVFSGFSLNSTYYQRKLAAFVAWAPVSSMHHLRAPGLKALALLRVNELFYSLGFRQFLPYMGVATRVISAFCKLFPFPCYMGMRLFSDIKPELCDEKARYVFMGHYPAGASLKSMMHISQLMRRQGFTRYREREEDPIVEYDLSRIVNVPIAILATKHGGMSSIEDARWLNRTLGSTRVKLYKEYEDMTDSTFHFRPAQITAYLTDTSNFLAAYHT